MAVAPTAGVKQAESFEDRLDENRPWPCLDMYSSRENRDRMWRYYFAMLAMFLLGVSTSFFGPKIYDEFDGNSQGARNVCITHPLTVDTPLGPVEVGKEGEQDMRDPFKNKLVRVIQSTGLVDVECVTR